MLRKNTVVKMLVMMLLAILVFAHNLNNYCLSMWLYWCISHFYKSLYVSHQSLKGSQRRWRTPLLWQLQQEGRKRSSRHRLFLRAVRPGRHKHHQPLEKLKAGQSSILSRWAESPLAWEAWALRLGVNVHEWLSLLNLSDYVVSFQKCQKAKTVDNYKR